jgi:hypothetical protein
MRITAKEKRVIMTESSRIDDWKLKKFLASLPLRATRGTNTHSAPELIKKEKSSFASSTTHNSLILCRRRGEKKLATKEKKRERRIQPADR